MPRTELVDRLVAARPRLLSVVAPPGYGKTTLLAQWAQRNQRRVAWISVDHHDNDPAVLLTYLAAALDRIEPIDPDVLQPLSLPGVVATTVVRRLAAEVASMTEPVWLVLDHLELLSNQECLDTVAELAVGLPEGSCLALASRSRPRLPMRSRDSQALEVGVAELAMGAREARLLLEGAEVGLPDADVDELVGRTEGWPVGLYLAALALRAGGPHPSAGSAFTGQDRFLADYLRSELLDRLSPELVRFLTRTAVLDQMSGPLCDAVLAGGGSGRLLASLEGSNLLLVALDRRQEWYRYHQLFRELLLAELDRREPGLAPQLHDRAAAWCEANGLPDTAIDHAQAAGDPDRVARLVWELAQPAYAAGRFSTVRNWLAWFEDQGMVQRYPPVAVQGAWLHALAGRPADAERWADVAERSSFAGTLPDGSTTESWVALLRALLCRDGVERMLVDAQTAVAGLDPGSPWRATAILLEGIGYLLDGQADRADPILAHAAEVATEARAMPAASAALAQRSIVAMDRDEWDKAGTLAERALWALRAGRLDNYVLSPLIYAVAARTAIHRGDVALAREQLDQAAKLRPLLTYSMPHRSVQTLLELGRAHLGLDDGAAVRTVLSQARDILQRRPDLGILPRQAEELWSRADTIHQKPTGLPSLTTAELRLLPLLPTHLTFAEIGQQLYVSRHTVKTQAISVYRKLGVSSRSQAVQRLEELGLST
ncbi:MAG TPA: LuxR C-terminal-related transcriptional regulator [Actinomycetes bacterium]|nr:LuxR C-terminal-related transcriptional regulator [Actinomycetes bacterium]